MFENNLQTFYDLFTECHTKKGVPCVFPFKYKNKIYNECTKVNNDKFWCSTEVDENGNFKSSGDEFWGNCDDNCQRDHS